MVALGWMHFLWMALFAGIIFGEKIWSRGIWVARTAGIGLAIAGMITALGIVNISGHDAIRIDQGLPDMNMQAQVPAEDQMSDNGMDM
jgi:hypothetical protein